MNKLLTLLSSALLATGAWAQNTENGHEYVDLGLPSGTLWATCNVGASSPEAYGSHFAWGETTTKSNYYWTTYKYVDHSVNNWYACTKYTHDDTRTDGVWYDSEGNFIGDGITVLESEDDVAAKDWGGEWKMPQVGFWNELCSSRNCVWTWTSDYQGLGIAGYIVTSKIVGYEGNSIFLPAAGYRNASELRYEGQEGCYWSSTLSVNRSNYGHIMNFNQNKIEPYDGNSRCYGFSVRPVIPGNKFISTPTDIPNTQICDTPKVSKTIENGQVVIIRNNKKYDLSGREL